MTGIYVFTNKINGKKYVGQSIDIAKRYYQHSVNSFNCNSAGYNSYFYKAIRKYGFLNFSFEILEECDKTKLNEREKYWIDLLKSNIQDFGYNLTEGGSGGPDKSKTIYQYDLNKNLLNTFKNAYEAERILGPGFHQSNIQSCAAHRNNTKTVNGYIFTYEGDDFSWHEKKNVRKVIRISKNGEETIFNTIKEAAVASGTNSPNIVKVLKGERKTAGGYYWKDA